MSYCGGRGHCDNMWCPCRKYPSVVSEIDYFAHRLDRVNRSLYSDLEIQFLTLPWCVGAAVVTFILTFPWS